MKKKNKIQKYAVLYSETGMCLGVAMGFMFHSVLLFTLGTFIGLALGEEKDKRLAKHMMKISRIRFVQGSSYKLIYALDKHGAEKVYKVNEKRMKQEKFSVGDRVAEEKEGILVSLERKSYCM